MLNEKSFTSDFASGDETKTIDELELIVGNTYYFKARTINSKDEFSEWSSLKSLLVGSLCAQKPNGVTTGVYSIYWSIPYPQESNVSYYQVEYVEQGLFKVQERLTKPILRVMQRCNWKKEKPMIFI